MCTSHQMILIIILTPLNANVSCQLNYKFKELCTNTVKLSPYQTTVSSNSIKQVLDMETDATLVDNGEYEKIYSISCIVLRVPQSQCIILRLEAVL